MSLDSEDQRFFVLHLAESDRPSPDKAIQIQLLDDDGRAASTGYAGTNQVTLELGGRTIPAPVIEAARRQPVGRGDYVNVRGESIAAF